VAREAAGARPASLTQRVARRETTLARLAPTLLVLAVLAATALAFVLTEHEKLARSPITSTRVDRYLAPACRCPRSVATIRFRLRPAELLRIELIAADGRVVRRLVANRAYPSKAVVRVRWDGRDGKGRLVADGRYRPRVWLEREDRTFLLPNRIRVDTKPPRVTRARVGRLARSRHAVFATYRLSEPASVVLLVDGKAAVRAKGTATAKTIYWYGRIEGRRVRPGRHRIQLVARDLAGNLGARTRPVTLRLR
jgi:hypothetical protein